MDRKEEKTTIKQHDHSINIIYSMGYLVLGGNAGEGLILGLRPANERRRYFVTTSLIGWVQA